MPAERLPPEAALAAYTSGVAYQAYGEVDWGSVTPGRRADLVWVDQDPLAVDAAAWPAIEVLGTWLGGRRTWKGR